MCTITVLPAVADLAWPAVALQVVFLLCLVVLSGTFSGSETALFSLTRAQLEHAAASHNPFRRLAAQLMRRPKQTLMTILVGNTAVNVLLFATSYVLFHRLALTVGEWVQPLAAVASIALVVIGGEVVPKVLGVGLAERLAPYSAGIVKTVGVVIMPLTRLIDLLLVEPFMRLMTGVPRGRGDGDVGRLELKTLLEMSRLGGAIKPLEDTFLRAVIDLQYLRVRDVMVPRVEMTAYDVNAAAEDLRDLMRRARFRKVPVYDGTLDDVVGLVYAKRLFLDPHQPLRAIVAPVHFVPDIATCEQLLRHFRETRSQLAIAVDEYGGVAGLVTLEDVLEKIVGELGDADPAEAEPEVRGLGESEYDVSGQLSVRHWAATFGMSELPDRVATIGGLVTARLGRPARVGDVVRLGNVELEVTRVERRRVGRVRLRLLGGREAEGGA